LRVAAPASKEENLDRKLETIDRRDEAIRAREAEIEAIRAETDSLRQRQVEEFQRISGLTREQARDQLMAAVEVEIRDDASRRVREIEKEVEATAGQRARKILATAIQRYTSEVTAEHGLRGANPERRDEGADYRARGPEHPRDRGCDRCGPDNR
jgi:ribonuclease Y